MNHRDLAMCLLHIACCKSCFLASSRLLVQNTSNWYRRSSELEWLCWNAQPVWLWAEPSTMTRTHCGCEAGHHIAGQLQSGGAQADASSGCDCLCLDVASLQSSWRACCG